MANLVTLNSIGPFSGGSLAYPINVTITTDDTAITTLNPTVGTAADQIRFDLINSAGTVLTTTFGFIPNPGTNTICTRSLREQCGV